MDRAENSLFATLERGDRNISNAHEEAIVLVGLSRAGKSTSFNWMLNMPMIGKGNLNSEYINMISDDPSVATIGGTFKSVTLVPNVFVDFTSNVSLADMAGFEDSRDYVGVIGVSYFLKALFEKVRRVKFVIVFSESRFVEENGAGIINTFKGFLNLFRFDLMTEEIKEKLIQSIGILVTRSKEGAYHFDYMKEVIERLNDQEIKIEKRELIIEFLKKLVLQARTEEFKKAKDKENPEKCEFVDRWNNLLNWSFFDLNEVEAELKQSVISVPFQRDYSKLSEEQKIKLSTVIDQRVESYSQLKDIILVFFETFVSNWDEFIKSWEKDSSIKYNYFQMKPLFGKIKEFVEKNDVYEKDESTKIGNMFYDPQTLTQSIKNLLKVFSIIDEIGSKSESVDFCSAMDLFSLKFSEMVDCFKSFVSCEEEEEDIGRFKLILNRGFREFYKLYELQPENIHDIKQKLPDYLNDIFNSKSKPSFLEKLINGLDSELLPKALPQIQLLEEYQEILQQYEEECDLQVPFYFVKNRSIIEKAKADLLMSSGNTIAALHCYMKPLLVQEQITDQMEEENEIELDLVFEEKIEIIKKIVGILKDLPDQDNFRPKWTALQLCINHNIIAEVKSIYELIIKSTSTPLTEKKMMYDDYANYLVTWGQLDSAISLLYEKISKIKISISEQKLTMGRIKEIMQNSEELKEAAMIRVADWRRLPNDPDLEQQLQEIRLYTTQ